MRTARLVSTAHYVPDNIVTNEHICQIVDTTDEWITSRTGIRSRHISTGENTSDLCVKVAETLLKRAGMAAEDIDLIIVATCSPDFLTPSTACLTQGRIGATNAFAFDISAACTGFIFALSTAQKFIAAGTCRAAIVIGAEVMSKQLDWQDRSSCVIFGDGAGGVLLESGGTGAILGEDLHADGSRSAAIESDHMTAMNPYSGAKPGRMSLEMNGRDVFDFATREVPKSLNALLARTGVDPDDIKHIIPHQANSRIVEIVARKVGIPLSRFYLNIDHIGNTSGASIPIALSEMVDKGLLTPGSGEKIILTGFGGGLTWGSVLFEM